MEYKRVSLADQVFERLEADILSGKYARGDVITELQLCQELGEADTRQLASLISRATNLVSNLTER